MPAIDILHSIAAPIRQPNQNDCWATAIAMTRGYTVQRVKSIASLNGVVLNSNGSLPDDDHQNIAKLARAFQMRPYRTSRVPAIARLAQLMRIRPVVLLGRINYSGGRVLHAITVVTLVGDGRLDNTRIGFVDPSDGRLAIFMYSEFSNRRTGPLDRTDYILA
jgi:hypothetical protein